MAVPSRYAIVTDACFISGIWLPVGFRRWSSSFMANLDQAPSRSMPNLLHVLPAFADEAELRLNTIVELNSNTINKYELITETGHLKLDRVGYSSLAYPFAYGCIPRTWDEDGDPLDIEIVNVTEPLIPGSIVEARIIGIMTFDDGGVIGISGAKLVSRSLIDSENLRYKNLKFLGKMQISDPSLFESLTLKWYLGHLNLLVAIKMAMVLNDQNLKSGLAHIFALTQPQI